MIPVLRFSKYNDSWIIASFSEFVAEIDSGWSPVCESNPADIDGWGSLKTTAITWDGFKPEENKRLPPKLKPKLESEIRKDDILIIRVSPVNRVGVVAHVDTERKRLMVSDNMLRIRLANGLTPEFVPLLCRTSTVRKSWLSKVAGMASAQVVISQKTIRMTKIVIPDLDEQREISTFFTKINLKIHLLTKKKQALETYKKGLMQKIFTQELRFKPEDGTDYSEWKSYKLNEVLIEHKMYSDGGEQVHSVSVHKGVVNQIEHLGRSFAAKNVSKYNKVLFGDVIYTKSPTGNFPYGIIKQSYVDNAIVSPLYCVTSPIDINIGYLLNWFFESNVNVHNYLHPIIQKGAKNTINISNDTFLSRSLFLPSSKAERRKIKEVYSSLNDNLRILESEIQKMTEFKKGLLQQMFV